jgi:ribose 5-phosphate isomerase B
VAVDRERIERTVREVLSEREVSEEVSEAPAGRGPRRPGPSASVALASDHGGFALKETLRRYLTEELGLVVRDLGPATDAPCDYPDFAALVARSVARGECERGIVIDGAGIGSAMAANKVAGVRAACCHDVRTVVNSRSHNNANVLTLGAAVVGRGLARQMVRVWLSTPFEGGRHERRVAKIMELEREWTGKS